MNFSTDLPKQCNFDIRTHKDPCEADRPGLKKSNQSKSDIRTFEQKENDQKKFVFKTKEHIAIETYYAFEDEDLTPRKKAPTMEELYGEIIDDDCIGEECKEDAKEIPMLNTVQEGPNRERRKKENDWYSNSYLEKGKLGISKEVGSWKYKFPHEHAQKRNFIAKGNIAPNNLRSKPKGKMRKSEWRKTSKKVTGMNPRQIKHLLSYGENFETILLKCSA